MNQEVRKSSFILKSCKSGDLTHKGDETGQIKWRHEMIKSVDKSFFSTEQRWKKPDGDHSRIGEEENDCE